MTKEVKILIGIAVLVVAGGVLLAIFANPQPSEPGAPVDSQNLVREHSPMIGNRDAKVTVVEFGDFQCPACAAAAPIMKRLEGEYKDNSQVNFVFRHFPLLTIHPNAEIGSEAAAAAGEQGKFWEMYDLLYQNQNDWSTAGAPMDFFAQYAKDLGLNVDQFKQAVEQKKFSNIIEADIKDGEAIGVNSTPTFYVGGEKMSTYQYDALKAKIEEKLKQ